MVISEFMHDHRLSSTTISTLEIALDDLHAYNILNQYLSRWKHSQWIMNNGRPVQYVDILNDLWNNIQNIRYTCKFLSSKTKEKK